MRLFGPHHVPRVYKVADFIPSAWEVQRRPGGAIEISLGRYVITTEPK